MYGMRQWFLKIGAAFTMATAVVITGFGVPFREAPPTIGVYRATAHTLRGREWQIGLPLCPHTIGGVGGV